MKAKGSTNSRRYLAYVRQVGLLGPMRKLEKVKKRLLSSSVKTS